MANELKKEWNETIQTAKQLATTLSESIALFITNENAEGVTWASSDTLKHANQRMIEILAFINGFEEEDVIHILQSK